MNAKLLLLAVLLVVTSLGAGAREVARTLGLSQDVFEEMQEIQLLIDDDALDDASDRLKRLQKDKLSDYELAQTCFLMGYVHYRKENFPAALTSYQQVLECENLPLGMQQNVIQTLSQLSMVSEDYDAALAYLEQLLELSEEPQATHYALKAQILYQLERMDEAMVALERAIQLQKKRGEPPRENWLLLKNAIYFQRNDFKGMLLVVQQLVDLYPRDRYLLNMASIYGEMGASEDQLALMEPLYERGSLDNPSHKVNLANLYLLHAIPYKAAVLLERELESEGIEATKQNLEMLAQAWLMSSDIERAIPPLSEAAKKSTDGNLYLRLARTHMSLTNWKDAERSLEKALEKGDLRDPSGTQLLLGMAQFNQKKFRSARRSFAQAGQDPRTEKLSSEWLAYLSQEEEKAKLLEATAGEQP